MKNYIQKSLAITALWAIMLGSIASTYAMSDTDFRKELLEQIKWEENLSDVELDEISKEIADISREDILASLLEEMNELEEKEVKDSLLGDFEALKKITDGEDFFNTLDEIYEVLDNFYVENGEDYEDEFEWEYDFDEEKKYIIENLKEEQKYIEDANVATEISGFIVKLEAETDEDDFFDMLDDAYDKIDTHYGIDFDYEEMDDEFFDEEDFDWEFDFEELKSEILEQIKQEREYIKDKSLKAKFETTLKSLEKENDEDAFFETLDAFYWDEALEKYYESQGIDLITGDEFLDGEYDFDAEKPEIISELTQELSELEDGELKTQLNKILQDLSATNEEDAFFEVLDKAYEKIDNHFGFEEEFEFNFEDERDEILEGINEEISQLEDENLKKGLKDALSELNKEANEDDFFEVLDGMYEKLDVYYEENFEIIEDYDDFEIIEDDFEEFEEDFDEEFDDDFR